MLDYYKRLCGVVSPMMLGWAVGQSGSVKNLVWAVSQKTLDIGSSYFVTTGWGNVGV